MIQTSSFAKLLEMEVDIIKELIIKELITKYSVEVLNGDISFERAIRVLHKSTGISETVLEQRVTEEVQSLCPIYSGVVP